MSKYESRWEMVTRTATAPASGWSNWEKAHFHLLNPNGLVATKRANDQIISDMAKDGRCKSGAIIAYGTFASYETDAFYKLTSKKRVGWVELSTAIDMLKSHIVSQRTFIAGIETAEKAVEEQMMREHAVETAEAIAKYQENHAALTAYVADLQEFLRVLHTPGLEHDGHRGRLADLIDALREAGQIN